MAKAKSVTPQSKPAVAAKKNVKAKQAAVKAETKKVVPKKVSFERACFGTHPRCTGDALCHSHMFFQADTSSSEEESSDEDETPVKANGAATPATTKVLTSFNPDANVEQSVADIHSCRLCSKTLQVDLSLYRVWYTTGCESGSC